MLFMAQLRQEQGWNIADGNDQLAVDIDSEGNALKEEFYRVAAVTSFVPCEHEGKIASKLYLAENDKIRFDVVDLPMKLIEEIAKGYHKIGSPFYQQLVDLRPEKQEHLVSQYTSQSGVLSYRKTAKNTIV